MEEHGQAPSSSPGMLWGPGAPRGRSAGPLGSPSLGRGSRCQLHASNFRLNPGSPPGPREPRSSALGSGRQTLVCVCSSRCRLIRLGPHGTLSSPPKRWQGVGQCMLCLSAGYTWMPGCAAGCVSMCVSAGVSMPVSVCVRRVDAFAELPAAGRVPGGQPQVSATSA